MFMLRSERLSPTMPSIRAAFAALVLSPFIAVAGTSASAADTRIFLIDNSEGYGIDGCLSAGAPCGEQVAIAWCRSHDYKTAIDFGRVEGEITASISPIASVRSRSCSGPACPTVVAITCSR